MKRISIISIFIGFMIMPAYNQSLYNRDLPKGYWGKAAVEKIPALDCHFLLMPMMLKTLRPN